MTKSNSSRSRRLIFWAVVVAVIIGIDIAWYALGRPYGSHSTSSPAASQATSNDPRLLRRQGKFTQALLILERRQNTNPSAEQAADILSVIEDTGDSLKLVNRSRQFAETYPDDLEIKWQLAKGLLFAAATYKGDARLQNSLPGWLIEAEQLIPVLEKANFAPPEVPGCVPILKAELAFMRGQYAEAAANCQLALQKGTTEGETGDLYSMLFDIAVRQGDLAAAEQALDSALNAVAEASNTSYYGLRMFREEAMLVREFVLDKPFTVEELDKIQAVHEDLVRNGFVDPTTPGDAETKNTHDLMRMYAKFRNAGDFASCQKIIDKALAETPVHTPRCFFSEAVASPMRALYLNLGAGKNAMKMSDYELARTYFHKALEERPGDVTIQGLLQKVQAQGLKF